MISVTVHVVMGKAVVSVRCKDIASGHDHCVWSGGQLLAETSPLALLEALAQATYHVSGCAHRDELDELTEDCLA